MPGSRGSEALAVVITLYITSFIATGLRFYTHGFILKHFFAEDYITLVSLVRDIVSNSIEQVQTLIYFRRYYIQLTQSVQRFLSNMD